MPRSESGFMLLPEGEMVFEIKAIGSEIKTEKSHYRVWEFTTMLDGEVQLIKQNMFPFMEIPVLEALGFKKDEKDGIDWEIMDVLGKRIRATVWHNKYKGKDKQGNEVDRVSAKIRDPKPATAQDEEIPF